MTERLLMGPGPSNAPPEVLEALGRPLLGHLDPEFLAILDSVSDRSRRIFQTGNRMTFAVSGTGTAGMEAALVNVLEPDDTVVIGVNGVFGARMCEMAVRAGAKVVRVEAQWGESIGAEAVSAALSAHPETTAVAIVNAETSTGVAQPMEDISAVVNSHGALFVVDAVTSLAGMPLDVDGWGIDVCYSGSQKCISVPPGLAPITFSDRALEKVSARKTPVQSWYLDVTLLAGYWGTDRVYHHTAPISMLTALAEGLRLVIDEGLEARWTRHAVTAELLTRELEARGFTYVAAEGQRLPMLHCVRVPTGTDVVGARKRLLADHGIEVGSGLGPFKDDCWRIGLMGHNCREGNVARLIGALDDILRS